MLQGAAEILAVGSRARRGAGGARPLSAARRDAHRGPAGGRGAHRPCRELGHPRGRLSGPDRRSPKSRLMQTGGRSIPSICSRSSRAAGTTVGKPGVRRPARPRPDTRRPDEPSFELRPQPHGGAAQDLRRAGRAGQALGLDQVEIRNDLAGVPISDGTAPARIRSEAERRRRAHPLDQRAAALQRLERRSAPSRRGRSRAMQRAAAPRRWSCARSTT